MSKVRNLLIASVLTLALLFVPFASYVTYPCNLFVTFVHESGHALAALATGGSVVSLAVRPDTSGVTWTRGGSGLIITGAGYTGALLFGLGLLILLRDECRTRFTASLTAVFLLLMTVSYGQDLVTYATGIASAAVFWFLAYRCSAGLAHFGMSFLAVQCVLNAFYDLRTLLLISTVHPEIVTDAQILSKLTGGLLSPVVWAAGLSGVSAVFALCSIWYLFKPRANSV